MRPGQAIDAITVVLFVVGLIVWYAGGHRALNALLDGGPLWQVGGVVGLIAGLAGGLGARAAPLRSALGSAAFAAVAVGGTVPMGLAIANRVFDGAPGRTVPAQVVRYHKPSKGPRNVTLAFEGRTLTVYADSIPASCEQQPHAQLEVRAGALGMPWLASATCSPAPR